MKEIGRALRSQRELRGWSLFQAARFLHLSPSALARYERGERRASYELLGWIAAKYDAPSLVRMTCRSCPLHACGCLGGSDDAA